VTTLAHARRVPACVHELVLVLSLVAVYGGVRAVSEGRLDPALANAERLMHAEKALRIAWESPFQMLILGHDTLVAGANWIYIYGHWPVIVASATYLYARHRIEYVRLRNAMIISGLVGFAFFALLPVAPPRLADPGLLDTVAEYSSGYRALQPPALTNQYAAMPSLHVGWNLLVAIALYRATRRRPVRAFAIVMPAAMAFAAIATANHFVLDAAAGSLLVFIAFSLSNRLQARTLEGGGFEPASSDAAPPPLPRRTPLGQFARGPASRGAGRRAHDRGGRAPLSRASRGAPSQDGRPGSDPVGPLEARESVPSTAARR
jgi:hypothetical protein